MVCSSNSYFRFEFNDSLTYLLISSTSTVFDADSGFDFISTGADPIFRFVAGFLFDRVLALSFYSGELALFYDSFRFLGLNLDLKPGDGNSLVCSICTLSKRV